MSESHAGTSMEISFSRVCRQAGLFLEQLRKLSGI